MITSSKKLNLDNVDLISVSSTQLSSTVEALAKSMALSRFKSVKLITHDDKIKIPLEINRVLIEKLPSSIAYSHFILKELHKYVDSDHVLLIQWDGYIINPQSWLDQYLDFDYIGARWPHYDDPHVVGNGGFSLRSRRLLEACGDPRIQATAAEDKIIARTHRRLLETEFNIRFAPPPLADCFSFERTTPVRSTFGFHGVFNMINILGIDEFATFYRQIDPQQVGRRELLDCFRAVIQQSSWRHAPLAAQIFRDWIVARNGLRRRDS